MKIILVKDHLILGKKNDIVNVKDGYARNFLLPQKIAMIATTGQINKIKEEQIKKEKTEDILSNKLHDIMKKIEKMEFLFQLSHSKDTKKTSGAITHKMIEQKIIGNLLKAEIELLPKKIFVHASEKFTKIGKQEVEIKLGHAIANKITIVIE